MIERRRNPGSHTVAPTKARQVGAISVMSNTTGEHALEQGQPCPDAAPRGDLGARVRCLNTGSTSIFGSETKANESLK